MVMVKIIFPCFEPKTHVVVLVVILVVLAGSELVVS